MTLSESPATVGRHADETPGPHQPKPCGSGFFWADPLFKTPLASCVVPFSLAEGDNVGLQPPSSRPKTPLALAAEACGQLGDHSQNCLGMSR
jgi:hypothetical protein